MKKIFKILFLLIVLFMTAGCSGNYNLKINSDLSIEENLELSFQNDDDNYYKTLKIFEDNKINKKKYDVNISSDKIIITYKDKFESMEDYILNSKVYPQIFSEIEYNKDNKIIDLYANQNLKTKDFYTKNNGSNLTDFDVIQINIENPFEMKLTNAEMINDNIYTWSIKKDDVEKTIKIQFKPTFNKFPLRSFIVGALLLIIFIYLIIILIKKYKNVQRV